MSKTMQIRISINPYYGKNLERSYPKLGRALKQQNPDLVNRGPSFYELAGQLDLLLYRYDGTLLRDVLARHKDKLKDVYARIEENMADRNLAKVDQLLYSIEDIFDEIEAELD